MSPIQIKAFGGKSVTRAPKGGFDHPVNGKHYRGGQFCPLFAVAGGSDEAKPTTPEGTIRFVETAPYGTIDYRWVVEQARLLDPSDPIEWTIGIYGTNRQTGKEFRLNDKWTWNTRGLAMGNLEHKFAAYAKSRKVERIG